MENIYHIMSQIKSYSNQSDLFLSTQTYISSITFSPKESAYLLIYIFQLSSRINLYKWIFKFICFLLDDFLPVWAFLAFLYQEER